MIRQDVTPTSCYVTPTSCYVPCGHLLAPAAQRRDFDLKLRHQPLGAAAAVVGATTTGREDDPIHGGIVEGFKLAFHGVAAEIHGLNLKGGPIHRGFLGCFGADQNHVDAAYVIAAFAVGRGPGFEEANFTDQQGVRVAKDGFAYPLEHVEFIVEAIRAGGAEVALFALNRDADRPSVVWVCVVGIKPERTYPAILRADSALFARLEGAGLRVSLFLRLEDFGGKLAAFFPRKLRQVKSEPLPYSESWRDVFWFFCHNSAK